MTYRRAFGRAWARSCLADILITKGFWPGRLIGAVFEGLACGAFLRRVV
jgi:hypothetical protein